MRVLVVDDEARLADLISRFLTEAGHAVDIRHNGPDGLLAATDQAYDAIVLDWMLPGLDGPAVCRELRLRGVRTPVLMLSARQQVPDRIAGLEAGSDDYLPKPFSLDELLARLRVFWRRAQPEPLLTVGEVSIDHEQRAASRDGVALHLTIREFDLLWLLASRAGRTVSRLAILDELWDGEVDVRSNVIDVHVATLRGKLDKPFGRALLATVRGVGYRLDSS